MTVLAGVRGNRYDSVAVVAVCSGDRLIGLATLERLVDVAGGATIDEVMDRNPPVVAPGTDQERAEWTAVDRAEPALAVVDSDGRFRALIPPQRLLAVLLEEHDEDLARLAGSTWPTRSAPRPGPWSSAGCPSGSGCAASRPGSWPPGCWSALCWPWRATPLVLLGWHDAGVAAGPLATVVQDLLSILIYFAATTTILA